MPGSVKGTYLRFLTAYACAYALGLVLFVLLSYTDLVDLQHAEVALALALIPLVYYLLAFKFAVAHFSRRGAYMLGVGLVSIPIIFVSLSTGGFESPNNIAFAVLVFLTGMLGVELLLILIWVQVMGFLLGLSGVFPVVNSTLIGILYVMITIAAGLVGWALFRRYRVHEDPMVERLRQTLHEEQLQSEAVIAAISDGVAIVNKQGLVIHANSQFLQNLALEHHELVGKYYKDVANTNVRIVAASTDIPRIGPNVATVLETGKPIFIDSETLEYTDNRPSIDVSFSIVPLKNDDGDISAVMIISRDISHIMRLQRMKDALISTASHELRTPITVIAGYADLLLGTSAGELNEKQRHYLLRTKETTAHLTEMVNNMLDSSKLESGERENNPEAIDLSAFLQHITEQYLAKFATKQISLKLDTTEGTVFADKGRLRQVVGNLLDNAQKFTQEAGEVVLTSKIDKNTVKVSVADNGPGISPEHQKAIFEKFTKLDTTGAYPGAGLGLAIARTLVEDWGGEIAVENVKPQGARFTFSIPLATHPTPISSDTKKEHAS